MQKETQTGIMTMMDIATFYQLAKKMAQQLIIAVCAGIAYGPVAMAQVNTYAPNLDTGRFVSPDATPEVKSWAPYDTSVQPQVNRSSQTHSSPQFINSHGHGTPENRINAPIPYVFPPLSPSGGFLLR
jgi:hypothetical protein